LAEPALPRTEQNDKHILNSAPIKQLHESTTLINGDTYTMLSRSVTAPSIRALQVLNGLAWAGSCGAALLIEDHRQRLYTIRRQIRENRRKLHSSSQYQSAPNAETLWEDHVENDGAIFGLKPKDTMKPKRNQPKPFTARQSKPSPNENFHSKFVPNKDRKWEQFVDIYITELQQSLHKNYDNVSNVASRSPTAQNASKQEREPLKVSRAKFEAATGLTSKEHFDHLMKLVEEGRLDEAVVRLEGMKLLQKKYLMKGAIGIVCGRWIASEDIVELKQTWDSLSSYVPANRSLCETVLRYLVFSLSQPKKALSFLMMYLKEFQDQVFPGTRPGLLSWRHPLAAIGQDQLLTEILDVAAKSMSEGELDTLFIQLVTILDQPLRMPALRNAVRRHIQQADIHRTLQFVEALVTAHGQNMRKEEKDFLLQATQQAIHRNTYIRLPRHLEPPKDGPLEKVRPKRLKSAREIQRHIIKMRWLYHTKHFEYVVWMYQQVQRQLSELSEDDREWIMAVTCKSAMFLDRDSGNRVKLLGLESMKAKLQNNKRKETEVQSPVSRPEDQSTKVSKKHANILQVRMTQHASKLIKNHSATSALSLLSQIPTKLQTPSISHAYLQAQLAAGNLHQIPAILMQEVAARRIINARRRKVVRDWIKYLKRRKLETLNDVNLKEFEAQVEEIFRLADQSGEDLRSEFQRVARLLKDETIVEEVEQEEWLRDGDSGL
jgi:hypothetical protein